MSRLVTVTIDEKNNLTVIVDGQPLPGVGGITLTQDAEGQSMGYGVVEVRMFCKVEGRPVIQAKAAGDAP